MCCRINSFCLELYFFNGKVWWLLSRGQVATGLSAGWVQTSAPTGDLRGPGSVCRTKSCSCRAAAGLGPADFTAAYLCSYWPARKPGHLGLHCSWCRSHTGPSVSSPWQAAHLFSEDELHPCLGVGSWLTLAAQRLTSLRGWRCSGLLVVSAGEQWPGYWLQAVQ